MIKLIALSGAAAILATSALPALAGGACCAPAAEAKPVVETVAVAKMDASKGQAAAIAHADLVKAIQAKKVTVIDVNSPDTYKAGRIPGAINFASTKNLAAKLPKDKNALIVAYCGNEYCGAYKQGVAAAAKLGYTNIKHYSPGIAGWKKSGQKVEKS